MKIQMKAGILLLLVFLLPGLYLYAQNDTVNIDEITVSASRVPTLYSETSRIVYVITKEEIELAPVRSINDLLDYAAGIDVRQRGANGAQADVSIRGGSFEQTLILLNGVKINDPQTGHHNLDLPVDIRQVERIEILEGPGSRVYGANAFCGAINIITSSKEEKKVKLSLSGGDYTLLDDSYSLSYYFGKMTNFLALSHFNTNGYIQNTDYHSSSLFYHTAYRTEKNTAELQAGFNNKQFGANNFYTTKFPNQYEETKTSFVTVKMSNRNKINFSPSLYWRRHHDYFILNRDTPLKSMNNHLTDVYGTDMNTTFTSVLGKTALGGELRTESILSNVLGDLMEVALPVPGVAGARFTKRKTRTNAGIFIEHNIPVNPFTLSAGLLINYTSFLTNGWTYYPGFDLSCRIGSYIKAFGSVNRSFRLPTYTELYYPGLINIGNPDLKPETAHAYELGAKYSVSWINGHVSVFRREGENIIDWVKETKTSNWLCVNLPEINTNGFEVSSRFNFTQLKGSNFFLKNITLDYAFLTMEKETGIYETYISKYVLDFLKHKFIFSAEHKVYKNTGISWRYSFHQRAGTYSNASNIETAYNPVWLLDARLFWKKNNISAFIEVTNLLNSDYYDIGNILMPPRWFRIGCNISIDIDKFLD